jgi:PEP-CTERM motif
MHGFEQMGASSVSEGLQVLRVPGDGGRGSSTNGSTLKTITFAADANSPLNFDFNYSGLAVDGVTVNGQPIRGIAAPEPASLLLLGIGAVPLLLKRRRS